MAGLVIPIQFDANGNQSRALMDGAVVKGWDFDGDDRSIAVWKGSSSAAATRRTRFENGVGGERVRRIDDGSTYGMARTTRYYGSVERIERNGVITWRRTIAGIAVQTFAGTSPVLHHTRFLWQDLLGSQVAVTDAGGSVIERTHFSVYGVRQGGQWFGSGVQTTERGFTNHEQVDDLETTHMNARVFDPTAGRFLQPDPLVQDVYRPQNWNPYAYAWNNPLRYTDPTGMFNVGRFLRTVASIAITIWLPGSSAIFGSLANSWFSAAVSGFFSGAVGSGSLRGGLTGAFSAGLFKGIDGLGWAAAERGKGFLGSGLTGAAFGGKIAAHGMAGGVMSHLQGGKFGAGFASAGFAQAFSPMIGGASTHAGKVIASAFVGGTASVISGGKFANGATTAAFSIAFSAMANRGASAGGGEWIFPDGGSTDVGAYDTVMTNGILGNRDEFAALVNREGYAGYFNPSHGFFADIMESVGQKFFGWAGDPLAAGLARGMAGLNRPMTIIAHSQGTLTVANAVRYYGLSAQGSTFVMKSPALSYFSASRAIQDRGGAMVWRQPYGDIANLYAPSMNPLRWASGFGDILCGACRHTANGLP